MSTSPSPLVVNRRKACAVCASGALKTVLNLPNLPFTGVYSKTSVKKAPRGVDQKFLYCEKCGHGQLRNQVSPHYLYGSTYSFSTSHSSTAKQGTEVFLRMLESVAPRRRFRCVVDVGANDLFLLRRLKNNAGRRIGIDPLLAGKEAEAKKDRIEVIGSMVEEIDVARLGEVPDLIVSRHTLEHIYDPAAILKKLFEMASEETLFLFEVPCLDSLAERLRFDQIFHQHLQYFSLRSFQRLIADLGGEYIAHSDNHRHWGALLIAFRKGRPRKTDTPAPTAKQLDQRYRIFKSQIQNGRKVLDSYRNGPVYGFGAAQMLPVLGYHMKTDFSFFKAVLDDDPSKDGLHYANMPLQIRHPSKIKDLAASTVFICAIDNSLPIIKRLAAEAPRQIIHPLHVF